MKRISPWQIVLVVSLITTVALLFFIFYEFGGGSARKALYNKNVDNRLDTVSQYVNLFLKEKDRLPSHEQIQSTFKDPSLFTCLGTGKQLFFVPNIENFELNSPMERVLIVSSEPYHSTPQNPDINSTGLEGKHSFSTALILKNGSVEWRILNAYELNEILFLQVETDYN